jgi:hypothetical protein
MITASSNENEYEIWDCPDEGAFVLAPAPAPPAGAGVVVAAAGAAVVIVATARLQRFVEQQ